MGPRCGSTLFGEVDTQLVAEGAKQLNALVEKMNWKVPGSVPDCAKSCLVCLMLATRLSEMLRHNKILSGALDRNPSELSL